MRRALNSLQRLACGMVVVGISCLAATCAPLVPHDADQFARNFIDTLRTQPPDVIEKFLDPQLAVLPSLADSLTAIRGLLPAATPDTLVVTNASVFWGQNATTRQIQYEMRAGGQRALIVIALTEHGAHRRISGLHVWPEVPGTRP